MTYDFIERDTALLRCPNKRCRRAGRCFNDGAAEPCRKTHQSADEFRWQLAAELDRLRAELGCQYDRPLSGYELDKALGQLKQALEESEREEAAEAAEAAGA